MLALRAVALFFSVAAAASSELNRIHGSLANNLHKSTNVLDSLGLFSGKRMTWYGIDTGPDACTGRNHKDTDFYVAMGPKQFGDGSGCCGRELKITFNGKTAIATCVDECATCPEAGQLDFTRGLFEHLTGGNLDLGIIYGDWSYVEDKAHKTKKPAAKATTSEYNQPIAHSTTSMSRSRMLSSSDATSTTSSDPATIKFASGSFGLSPNTSAPLEVLPDASVALEPVSAASPDPTNVIVNIGGLGESASNSGPDVLGISAALIGTNGAAARGLDGLAVVAVATLTVVLLANMMQ